MRKQRQHAVIAGGLFLVFAALTATVFVQWFRSDPNDLLASLQKLSGGGGAVLMVGAFVVGGVLLARPVVGIIALVLSLIVAAIGFIGMYVVGPLWLLPLPFVWLAYRGRHDA